MKINEIIRERDQKHFFLGWEIRRNYSKEELDNADLLLINLKKTFEPSGVECGTQYDNKDSCIYCGYGIKHISNLLLSCRSIPKNVDIARTISSEILVSSNFSSEMINNDFSGFSFTDVYDNLTTQLCENWKQLKGITSIKISPETITGNDPFDLDLENKYRCIRKHTIGLNRLSELIIFRNSWDGSDFVVTDEHLGVFRGLLRTYPLMCISQKVYRSIIDCGIRGMSFEIVRMI